MEDDQLFSLVQEALLILADIVTTSFEYHKYATGTSASSAPIYHLLLQNLHLETIEKRFYQD